MKLAGKSVLVTGGSRGLGRAIAEGCLREGARVVLAARDAAALKATADEISKEFDAVDRVAWKTADVAQPADVEALVRLGEARFGHIDVLVANAGVYGPFGRVDSVDWQAWVDAVQINLLGTVLCCRAVLPAMVARASGKIITLSGGGATGPLPRISAYAASKAAVVRFTETLAQEVRDVGIDVNAVAPGALNTRLLEEVLGAGPESVGQQFFDQALRQRDEGGASPERAAELVAFLASSESDGITGRLISAVWDDWRELPKDRERLAQSDVYTLRRIVPADRGWG